MLILSTKSTKTSGAGLHRGGGERKNDRDLKMDNGKVDEEELIYLERGSEDKAKKRSFWWSFFIRLDTRRHEKDNNFSEFFWFYFYVPYEITFNIPYSLRNTLS